jgi:hypothetical protein
MAAVGRDVVNQSELGSETGRNLDWFAPQRRAIRPPSVPWPRIAASVARTPRGGRPVAVLQAPRSASVGDIRAARPAG